MTELINYLKKLSASHDKKNEAKQIKIPDIDNEELSDKIYWLAENFNEFGLPQICDYIKDISKFNLLKYNLMERGYCNLHGIPVWQNTDATFKVPYLNNEGGGFFINLCIQVSKEENGKLEYSVEELVYITNSGRMINCTNIIKYLEDKKENIFKFSIGKLVETLCLYIKFEDN